MTYSSERLPIDNDDPELKPELAGEWVNDDTLENYRRQRMERKEGIERKKQPDKCKAQHEKT